MSAKEDDPNYVEYDLELIKEAIKADKKAVLYYKISIWCSLIAIILALFSIVWSYFRTNY
jgi:hypothetical protein